MIKQIKLFIRLKKAVKTGYWQLVEIIFFILGLCFGSFANVVIYRVPRNLSIVYPFSFCPLCKNKIKFYDNIPLISFLLLKGKCRFCGEKISFIYPFVEFLTGVLFLLSYLKFKFSPLMFEMIFLNYFLMIMAFIDYETGYIYDVLLFPSLYTGFIISFFNNHLISSIFYAFFAFFFGLFLRLIFGRIFKKEALGEGDPYVFALIAIYIRGFDLFFVFFLSFLIGSILGFILILRKKEKYLPLLPFLFTGTFLYYIIYPFPNKILLKFFYL
ncbi:MAG: prepilin peptidase [candidate division WOR-3 bacterium]